MIYYRDVIWPINMVLLGVASIGVFVDKGKWKKWIRTILFLVVLALPICLPFFGHLPNYFFALSVIYVIFFSFIIYEILRFLIKPSYINVDIISASACGYLLLVEISVFLMQVLFYHNPDSLSGISSTSNSETFIDLVYFSTITLTSIGFGDIVPKAYYTKLMTSLFGIIGQCYTVVLVGNLISKFSAGQK